MCLKLRFYSRKRTAKEDIICYKWLRFYPQFGTGINVYRTPFRNASVNIGEKYTSELNSPFIFNEYRSIDVGLHSFADRSDAEDIMTKNYSVIVQCIIPKGSKYYVGDYYGCVSYASNTIIYEKVIHTY